MNTKLKATTTHEKLGVIYDAELADLLRITVPTLKNRRSRGDAPPSAKVGRVHITTIDDLKRWLAQRRARPAA
jgi:hypothetical protein